MTLTLTKFEKRWGWVFLLLYILVLPFLVGLLLALAGVYTDAAANLLCFFLTGALAVVFFRRLLASSVRHSARSWKHTVVTASKGFALYWILNFSLTFVILMAKPDFGNVNDANVGSMLDQYPLLMTLAVIFAAPLAEECLFRGWIFTGLAQRSVPLAYIVTCGFFAAAHVTGYIGRYDGLTLALCFLQYIGPSFALCWVCRQDDSLCAPLLMHMTINAIACLLN